MGDKGPFELRAIVAGQMAGRFEGTSVFITGGSSGIGAALGVEFAREGAKVALAARSVDRLAQAVKAVEAAGGEAIAVRCDVTDRASLDAAVAETVAAYGGIDVVVANAGFGVDGLLANLSTDDYRRQFDTNVFGVIDTIYATLPHLIESRGRLGIVSSVLGKLSRPTMSAYAASKFALCGLTEAIYYELREDGVSVTCINPGLVASNFRIVDNTGNVRDDWTDPAPQFFVMPADRAARQIVRTMYRRRFEVNVTLHGKFAIAFNRLFPRLSRAVLWQATKGRMRRYDRSLRDSKTDEH